jgi:hypothetical protein
MKLQPQFIPQVSAVVRSSSLKPLPRVGLPQVGDFMLRWRETQRINRLRAAGGHRDIAVNRLEGI